MKFFITGGAGFIGSYLAERLVARADKVLVLDVYSAGEQNESGVQAADLAHQMPNATYAGDFETAREMLETLVGPGDLLLLMGAGDINKLGDELAHRV